VIVNGGLVKNAFVVISEGLDGWLVPPAPTTEVIIDQRGCIYHPRVVGVRAGQPVTFVNSDQVYHNVRTVAHSNPTFNLGMPNRDMRITKTFSKAEVAVHAKCDMHPWMAAFIGVAEHPFFAVTNERGEFDLPGVPPGNYTVQVWHEVFGTLMIPAEVAPGTKSELRAVFNL